jgi:hypothetical protein
MTLWYFDVKGAAPNSHWQMGMYAQSDALNDSGAWNSWQAWCFTFFVNGVTHAFGFLSFMTPSQTTQTLDQYAVNELTDRKTKLNSIAFANVGTSANTTSLPGQVSILTLLTPAVRGSRKVGRLYLPPTSQGLYGSTVASNIANETADFMKDGFTAWGVNLLYPVIRDRKNHTHVRATTLWVSNIPAIHKTRVVELQPGYAPRTW